MASLSRVEEGAGIRDFVAAAGMNKNCSQWPSLLVYTMFLSENQRLLIHSLSGTKGQISPDVAKVFNVIKKKL